MPPAQDEKLQIVALQGLRALAAMGVVGLHLYGPTILAVGNAGVDLFFVISGFVMVYSSAPLFGSAANARLFALRRIARIVPLYWLFVAIEIHRPEAGYSGDWTEILRSLAFIPYLNTGGRWLPIGLVGWTLNYEMFFYALFALALLLPRRRGVPVAIAMLAALASTGWLAHAGYVVLPFGVLQFWTDPIVADFAFGCVIAAICLEGYRIPRPLALVLVATGVGALAYFYPPQPYLRPLVWGLPAASFVAAACLVKTPWRCGPIDAPVRLLGDASYALYLIHLPLLIVVLTRGHSRPVTFCVAIAGAIAVHLWLEKPMTRTVRELLNGPARERLKTGSELTALSKDV